MNETLQLITGVPVRVGTVLLVSNDDQKLRFDDGYKISEIPYIRGIDNQRLSELIHYYFIEQLHENILDLSSQGRAFYAWVSWLQINNINPFDAPLIHKFHPTYGFRYHLIERVKSDSQYGQLSSSTASTYMNHIKNFYKHLDRIGILQASNFFRHQTSIVNNNIAVQTSDLSISRVSTKEKSLNPFSKNELSVFLEELKYESVDFQIMCRLMLFSGLRLQEMLTLPRILFDEASFAATEGNLIRGLIIGKSLNQVNTKFGKHRELFVSKQMYEDVLDYMLDDQIEKRLRKWRTKNVEQFRSDPLFITRTGTTYTSQAFYSRWYPFINRLRQSHSQNFKHKPHDCRATFGTSFLKAATNSGVSVTAALGALKVWMGHSQLSTTINYVKYLERNEISRVVAEVMDSFISEASIFTEADKDGQ